MKKPLIALSLMLLCSSSFAVEPTCAAPGAIGTTPFNATGSTCASGSNLTALCLGGQAVFGPQAVYSMVVGANSTLTVSVTGTTPYDTALYVEGPTATPTQAACESSLACDAFGSTDATLAGGTETITPASAPAAGTYYVIISSTNAATGDANTPPAPSAGCGAYALAVTGTLPVKLNGFSVD
jgi:hypothetical protein